MKVFRALWVQVAQVAQWAQGASRNHMFWHFRIVLFAETTLQIFTPWNLRAQGSMGCLQVFPALSMEKGCKNHIENLNFWQVLKKELAISNA